MMHSALCGSGRDKEEVRKDVGRNRYFTPEQAIEYVAFVNRIPSRLLCCCMCVERGACGAKCLAAPMKR